MFERILEFFVEYLLIATILIITLGVGWTLGIDLKKTVVSHTRHELQQEAVNAGVARYNPHTNHFEWIQDDCDAQ